MELSNKDLDSLLLKANNFKENWLQSSDARDLEEAVELLRTILAHNSYEFRGKALRLIALLLYSVERLEEAEAYRIELEWYEEVLRSPFLAGLTGEERAAWDWATDSAVRSAQKAAERAGPRGD